LPRLRTAASAASCRFLGRDLPILAPGPKVLAKEDSILSNLIGGAKTKIAGPELADALLCP